MKTALIPSGSSGIGADAARHLAKAGFQVILVARGQENLTRVAEEIGPRASTEVCDVSIGGEVRKLAERVQQNVGVPDVIVNSAGIGQWKRIEETGPEEALQMIKVPYLAAFFVTQAFIPGMLARRSGVLIHVNWGRALAPWPSSVAYAAARWALRGFNEALYQDLAGTGVKTCGLVLGRVDSPYFDHNPESIEHMPKIAGMIRTLSTDECGRIIARLAQSPRREVIYPRMLRYLSLINQVCPSLFRILLQKTGRQRSV